MIDLGKDFGPATSPDSPRQPAMTSADAAGTPTSIGLAQKWEETRELRDRLRSTGSLLKFESGLDLPTITVKSAEANFDVLMPLVLLLRDDNSGDVATPGIKLLEAELFGGH